MKTKINYLIILETLILSACSVGNTAEARPTEIIAAQIMETPSPIAYPAELSGDIQPTGGGTPPQEAISVCTEKSEQDVCEFTSQKGTETGVCETVQGQPACSPKNRSRDGGKPDNQHNQSVGDKLTPDGSAYNIEQAISDKAQGMTIAYDALAFMTGDLGSDSFFPPGKITDFWGFQYLRDNDPSQMGHAGEFLTNAAMNVLNTLTEAQRAELVALATSQVDSINEYGNERFVLMDAFRRLVEGDLADGTTSLDQDAVKTYSAELYRLDGEIIYNMAVHFTEVSQSLTNDQKEQLLVLRKEMLGDLMYPTGAYLYSQAIPLPVIPSSDFLFK